MIGTVCYLAPDTPKPPIETIRDITAIGIFSITITFFFLESADMFLKQAIKQEAIKEERERLANLLREDLEENADAHSPDSKLVRELQEHTK